MNNIACNLLFWLDKAYSFLQRRHLDPCPEKQKSMPLKHPLEISEFQMIELYFDAPQQTC